MGKSQVNTFNQIKDYKWYEFLVSAKAEYSCAGDYKEIVKWINQQKQTHDFSIRKVDIGSLDKWKIDEFRGELKHESGGFFQLQGLRVKASSLRIQEWDQPIINQNEIGYLGFITKKIKGVLHFLAQAKIEPGNINGIQLSPTLQATKSNYLGLHKGKKPLYLEYFKKANKENIIVDTLQSEIGCRFLKKRNRNIIINIKEDILIEDGFKWVTLKDLKKLMKFDNLVNMDTRSVLSNVRFFNEKIDETSFTSFLQDRSQITNSFFGIGKEKNTIDQILNFITYFRYKYTLSIENIKLEEMKGWELSKKEIKRFDGKYFKVIGVEASICNREVISWQQPMIEEVSKGLCSLIGKNINNVFHIIVQAKLECGNRDNIELAPSLQINSAINEYIELDNIKFLDYTLNSKKKTIIFSSNQSDEGGRFYQVEHNYRFILADEDFNEELPEGYIWITLNQLVWLNRFDGYINHHLRNFLAMIEI